ncbi:universal stress protein [Nitriliruptor alkaliphilus]|uniref:universal stress protein n=1 Tax=Nitriliruptor alkaliphilus TaxID=427918 RepID=UPI000695D9A7|nr:universal stress protein [Nitriliruptor alkaliphilus]
MEIVVGYTARAESRFVLERAIEEATLRGARLHIVRTVTKGPSENPAGTRSFARSVAEVRQEGESLVERLSERGVAAEFRLEPIDTDPAVTLLNVARAVGADLIVIGIRRRSPVGKLVLGSVSQSVLLGADCAVLAVKGDDDDGR